MMTTSPSNILLLILFIMLTGCTAPLTHSPPCVYESTKGIAEVIEINLQQVTFKFYPGDQFFSLSTNTLINTNISLNQELKAIIRTPLSGPCEETEFELLAAVE